jgi:hypothetical protein
MHALKDRIHGVVDKQQFGDRIAAAMGTLDFRAIKYLLAAAEIDPYATFVTNGGGPIKLADLDARLDKVHMGRFDRMVLKATLDRLELLVK